MIIVDTALARRVEERRPVRVGMIGAGAMGRGIARQIIRSVPGLRMAAISNRNVNRAQQVYAEAGIDDALTAESAVQL